jgi:hypothetical protein
MHLNKPLSIDQELGDPVDSEYMVPLVMFSDICQQEKQTNMALKKTGYNTLTYS